MSGPRAVIWDVGNVIVRWSPRTLYSQIFSDPAECDRFLSHVCTMDWHMATDCGVTFAENCAALSAEHPEYAREIAAWQTRWSDMFSGAIPETEAAIEALHEKGVAQFVLSNMSHETFDDTFAMSPAFGRIADQVISGHEGVIKPDPVIFRLACQRFGGAPEDFLFIDDGAHNTEAARALGFHVHHFTDPAALRPALEAAGLL
ncbi:HAD family phosphatase [Phenylobacterium sp.]|uniref:HAD family hydrolase n=1 Tax=Phenylobacterium sp. TaxID=1871053 RepID=UPI002E2F2E2A|nr:HAD family phosphatase [Phenylobacterium sp.]HEX4712385.1 HAD family phosphatase [Phenylobacterium sp.]